MSRKELFAHLSSARPADHTGASAGPSSADVPRPNRLKMRPLLGSPELLSDPTPVGAIGQTLGEFTERAKRAEEIEKQLTNGQVIVELDPEMIDPSFISDRMPASPETYANLTEAIREHGQINPILVRPHPETSGHYQVAFGHRRLRSVKALGRKVRAVVRELSDEQLVVAQGQENHERQDLSYIEKALFARRLEQRFNRATIMAALSVYKSDLSNMLSVATKIPEDVIQAIGPAPGIGRRGWIELSAHFANVKAAGTARKAALEPELQSLDSDERFKRVLAATKPRSLGGKIENWSTAKGAALAKVIHNDDRVSLTIDRRKAPKFAEFVLNRLRDLYSEFEAGSPDRP
jgi:ParB family transcriptional regulator, chromosome partitioning protein